MHMHHAGDVTFEQSCGIATSEQAMPGVVQQSCRCTRCCHEPIDLGVRLNDGTHVMMKCHAETKLSHAFSKRRDLAAITAPFVIGKHRTPRRGLEHAPVATTRSIGVDDNLAAEIAQQSEMWFNRCELLLHFSF